MRCTSGYAPSLEVALGLVKPTDEHGLFTSEVEHHRDRSMSCRLNHGYAHFGRMLVKIVFGEGQFFAVEKILQCPAIAAEVPRVDQKVRACPFSMLENQLFSHMILWLAVVFDAFVVGFPFELLWVLRANFK